MIFFIKQLEIHSFCVILRNTNQLPGWRNGRRKRLKIFCPMDVRVRVPPRVPGSFESTDTLRN